MGSQGSCICLCLLLSIFVCFHQYLINHSSICDLQFKIIKHLWILRHRNCNPFIPLERNISWSIISSRISIISYSWWLTIYSGSWECPMNTLMTSRCCSVWYLRYIGQWWWWQLGSFCIYVHIPMTSRSCFILYLR